MRKGTNISRLRYPSRINHSLNYHMAHQQGRSYLCGCFRAMRCGDRTISPHQLKGSKAYKLRRNKF